jgi:hypothetical protein
MLVNCERIVEKTLGKRKVVLSGTFNGKQSVHKFQINIGD